MSTPSHSLLFIRNEREDYCVAILTCDGPVDYSSQQILDIIVDGITDWMCLTAEGRNEYIASGYAYNIGDFINNRNNKELLKFITERGVWNIDVTEASNEVVFSYDAILPRGQQIDGALTDG